VLRKGGPECKPLGNRCCCCRRQLRTVDPIPGRCSRGGFESIRWRWVVVRFHRCRCIGELSALVSTYVHLRLQDELTASQVLAAVVDDDPGSWRQRRGQAACCD
jgi:hypothetical protein